MFVTQTPASMVARAKPSLRQSLRARVWNPTLAKGVRKVRKSTEKGFRYIDRDSTACSLMDRMHFQWGTFARTSTVALASAWSTWTKVPTMSASANPRIKEPTAWHVSEHQLSRISTLTWIDLSRIWKKKRKEIPPIMSAPVPASPCEPNPCKNGGSCIKGDRRFHCACPDGHTGKFCQNGQPSLTVIQKSRDRFSRHGAEVIPLPSAPRGFFPNSSHWLLCGKRRDVQRLRQRDGRRTGLSQLEFQLYFHKWWRSLQPVHGLWRPGGELLQVWLHRSSHGSVTVWKTFTFFFFFTKSFGLQPIPGAVGQGAQVICQQANCIISTIVPTSLSNQKDCCCRCCEFRIFNFKEND